MNLSVRQRFVRVAIAVSLSLMTSNVWGQGEVDAEQCLEAHERVQVTRAAGDLLAARDAVAVCVKAACPDIVRRDCVVWYSEVTQSVPSLIVTASEGDRDLLVGRVYVDDIERPAALNGAALPLNPGRHTVRVVRSGQPAVEKVMVLSAGESGRRMHFELSGPTGLAPQGTATEQPEQGVTVRPIPMLTYLLAGASLAGFATGATFGSIGIAEKKGLLCAPFCSMDQKDSVDTKLLMADIGYGVGVAAGIAALVTYLVRPEVPVERGEALATGLRTIVSPQLAYVGYAGAF